MVRHYVVQAQTILAALFLFSGMFKGVVPAPLSIDWTVLLAVLLCASLLPSWREVVGMVRDPVLWLFCALVAWLVASAWPLAPFGVYKVAEALLFGIPAMSAGYVISRGGIEGFGRILAALSVPISIIAIWTAIQNGTVSRTNEVLSGGYQLTATLLGFGFLYAALSERTWLRYPLVAIIGLGLAVVGSIAAFFATIAIAGIMLVSMKRWRSGALSFATLILVLVGVSVVFGPPAAVARIGWKLSTEQLSAPDASKQVYVQTEEDGIVDATGRSQIFRYAFDLWLQKPLTGHGFGSLEYVDGYRTPHNIVLEMLAEGGLVAGALLIAMSAAALWPPLRQFSAHPLVLALLLSVFIAHMTGGYFIGRIPMFAIGAAMAMRNTGYSPFRRQSPQPVNRH